MKEVIEINMTEWYNKLKAKAPYLICKGTFDSSRDYFISVSAPYYDYEGHVPFAYNVDDFISLCNAQILKSAKNNILYYKGKIKFMEDVIKELTL